MDPLLDELIARGALDASGVRWARRHQTEHGGALSSVLLELDLVDEEDLMHGLSSCFRLPCATADDVSTLSTDLAARFPESFSRAFDLCPLRLQSPELVVLVSSPLSAESCEELHELFGLEVRQLLCDAHALALARARVYGHEPDERTRALEARLARRRGGGRVRDVVERLSNAGGFGAAAGEVLRFANAVLDFAVLLRANAEELRVAASGSGHVVPAAIAVPDPGCTLAAALRHGSHFLGPLAGNNPADLSFFESLGRAVPRWAFVAPVPLAGARSVVLYADNGPRGIAPRWLAELTLVVARLGQLANAPAKAVTILPEPEIEFVPATLEAADLAAEPEVGAAHAAEHAPGVDASERAILERLRTASHQAGMELGAFVDELLAQRTAKAPADATAALMGEVRGLFERLATDIPAQMALGMQNAFRDIVPRLSPAAVSAPASPAAAAAVELVVGEAKPREVPSYRSRRSKTTKVKL